MNEQARVVAISGASRGLGHALAVELFDRGYAIAVLSRSQANFGDRDVLQVQGDVGDGSDVKDFFKTVGDVYEGVDVVIANAGVTAKKSLGDFIRNDFDRVMRVNVWGAVDFFQQALPLFSDRGSLVYVSSSIVPFARHAYRFGSSGYGLYGASKYAMRGFIRTVCHELNDTQRMMAFHPFRMDTGFSDTASGKSSPSAHKLLPERYATYMADVVGGNRLAAAVGFVSCWGWWGKQIVRDFLSG